MKGTETAFISLCSELQHLWVNPDCPWHDCLPEPRGWWIWSSINREAGKEADSFQRCCKLPVCRSRRKRGEAANVAYSQALPGSWSQPALWPCQGGRELNTENWHSLLWAASGYLQPLWTMLYMDIAIFHVPARCPPASLQVIRGQETRNTLKPSTDLLSLETAHQSWLLHPCNWNLCK